MYHHIAPAAERPTSLEGDLGWEFAHEPEALQLHIEHLRRKGRRFVGMADYVAALEGSRREELVALTFDDGWIDNYHHALPVLRAREVPATFFVTTAHLAGRDDPLRMSADHLREAVDAGVEIGAHTRTHPDLRALSPDDARREIAGSKEDLESLLGCHVRWFAYPGGAFRRSIADLVRTSGYEGAVSCLGPGRNRVGTQFWLFRDVLGEDLRDIRSRARLNRAARLLLELRVGRRLHAQLSS